MKQAPGVSIWVDIWGRALNTPIEPEFRRSNDCIVGLIEGTFMVPREIEARSLNVALWLPDAESRNWNNSRFSIRLAYRQDESDLAQPNSPGHNLLARDIPVAEADAVVPENPTGLEVF